MTRERSGLGLLALGWGVWGLGLARYLAEALHLYLLFSSPPVAGGVALAGAGLALAIWWVFPVPLRPHLAYGWAALLLPLAYVLAPRPDPLMGLVLLVAGPALATLLAFGTADLQGSASDSEVESSSLRPTLDRRAQSLVPLRRLLSAPERLGPSAGGGSARYPIPRWLLVVLLALAVFGLYLRTLGRAVGQADTFEFQVVAPTLGIAHPTGYPLYILLGKLFSLLPIGPVASRVNLTSAVFATGAVLIFYLLLDRLTREPLVALLSAFALALSRVLWSQAVVAEVYALNLLFVAEALLLAAVLLEERGSRRTVWGLALLLGLSLTNHLTMVLLLPAVGLALLLARPRMSWRDWVGTAGLFLLGLTVYAYIPLRWPALHGGRWMSLGEFLAYVTGRQFGGTLQAGLLRDPTRYAILSRLLVEPFDWAGVTLAVLGLGWLAARCLKLALLSVLAFFLYCLYGLAYRVPDISVFLLPVHLLLALWMGMGVAALAGLARHLRAWLWCLAVALFALLPLSRVWLNLPVVDQSQRLEGERWGRHVLDLPLAQGAAALADGEKFAPLYYLQRIEGHRPDLDLVVHFAEEEYRADLLARLGAGQTIYLARYLPHLEGTFLRSLGPLVEVGTAPLAKPPPGAAPVGAIFGAEVELVAFDLQEDPQGRPLWHLTLYWRATATPRDDLEVRLRLVDGVGEVAWASDGARPVGGNYPTNAWPPGTVVPDYHPVPVPPWLAPGRYVLQVALFPRFSDRGLAADGGPEVWRTLTPVTVGRLGQRPPLPQRTLYAFGTTWLVGYDLPTVVPAGSPVPVDLAWAGVEEGGAVRLEWADGVGQAVTGKALVVVPGTVRSRAQVVAPSVAGAYKLRVGWEGRQARCRWLAAPTSACDLAAVQVEPARQGLANFDGRISLVAAEVGAERLRAGEVLLVMLRWRALRAMAEDYTITAQLLGPDGRLHGQVDSWPVQGTLPTSRWTPGQEVTDLYRVPLAADAPPGHYQVVVGWYLLATMERLPVVDTAGHPVADHVVIGEVEVTAHGSGP